MNEKGSRLCERNKKVLHKKTQLTQDTNSSINLILVFSYACFCACAYFPRVFLAGFCYACAYACASVFLCFCLSHINAMLMLTVKRLSLELRNLGGPLD